MKLIVLYESSPLDWRKILAGGVLAGSALIGCDQPIQPTPPEAPAQTVQNVVSLDMGKLSDFIKYWEGVRYKAYKDSRGIPTVGVGFNLTRRDAPSELKKVGADYNKIIKGGSLTDEQVNALLKKDVAKSVSDARRLVKSFDSQPEEVQRIIADLAYNLGADKFRKFKDTIKALDNRDYLTAAKALRNSRWYEQVGRRSKHHVDALTELSRHDVHK